jgi:TetR/AcrR family transcriptional repressor of nem operon
MNDAQIELVLDTTQQLISAGGYSALTYDAIAAQTNLPAAAIQAQFPDLSHLVEEMLQRYYRWLQSALNAIDAGNPTPPVALTRFVELYCQGMREDRLCLCGLMAAESKRLPDPLSERLRQVSQLLQTWLTRWFEQGQQTNSLTCLTSATIEAQLFAAALQGAQLSTHLMPDSTAAFQDIADRLLWGVGVVPEPPAD